MHISGFCSLPVQIKCWKEAIYIQENYASHLDYVGDNQIATGLSLLSSFLTYRNSETKLSYQPVSDKFSANL